MHIMLWAQNWPLYLNQASGGINALAGLAWMCVAQMLIPAVDSSQMLHATHSYRFVSSIVCIWCRKDGMKPSKWTELGSWNFAYELQIKICVTLNSAVNHKKNFFYRLLVQNGRGHVEVCVHPSAQVQALYLQRPSLSTSVAGAIKSSADRMMESSVRPARTLVITANHRG